MYNLKVGDWVIHEMAIKQIKEIREGGRASVSDGFFETSGMLLNQLRPLTLRNKRIAESFDIYYMRLREINGERGFNYPDINRYFSLLVLKAIDSGNEEEKFLSQAIDFVNEAKSYTPFIQGVPLFRPNR